MIKGMGTAISETIQTMRPRLVSWASAGVILLIYCWLGRASLIFGQVYKGFEGHLPALLLFSIAYGAVVFPACGILGAIGIVLANRFRRDWFQAILFVMLVVLVVCITRSFMKPRFFSVLAPISSATEVRTAKEFGQ